MSAPPYFPYVPPGVSVQTAHLVDRCGFPNYPAGMVGQTNFRWATRHRNLSKGLTGGVLIEPQIVVGNYLGGAPSEGPGKNPFLIEGMAIASALYPTFFSPVTFGGAASYQLAPGKEIASDPIPGFVLDDGEDLIIHWYCSVTTAGMVLPADFLGLAGTVRAGEGYTFNGTANDGTSATNNTLAAGFSYSATSTPYVMHPLRVLSRLPQETITSVKGFAILGIGGDSIATGYYDTLPSNAHPETGYVNQALAQLAKTPIVVCPMPGAAAKDWSLNMGWRRNSVIELAGCSHVYDPIGTNDANTAGQTLANMKLYASKRWRMLRAYGARKILAMTLLPHSYSSLGCPSVPTIAAAGTGYPASSTFNVSIAGGTLSTVAGNPGTATVLNVTSNSSGAIASINSVVSIGYYSTAPSGTVATTATTGSGLTVALPAFAGWLDVPSQTPAPNWGPGSAAAGFNAWLRTLAPDPVTGLPLIDGAWDASALLSNGAVDSGIWKPLACSATDQVVNATYGVTGGLHPAPATHTAMVAPFLTFLQAQGLS